MQNSIQNWYIFIEFANSKEKVFSRQDSWGALRGTDEAVFQYLMCPRTRANLQPRRCHFNGIYFLSINHSTLEPSLDSEMFKLSK